MNVLKLMTVKIVKFVRLRKFKHLHSTAYIQRNVEVLNPDNLYMGENTNINRGAIIMNTKAKFVMKKYSGAAAGLLVSTGNHALIKGMWMKNVTEEMKVSLGETFNKDVIVEEDVWLASRVTLLYGVKVGRGAIVGSGSVVRTNIPPYAVVIGNPAKVIGFIFTPAEIIEHEKNLYPENERLPLDLLEKNYKKYFLDHLKEIKAYTGLICK